jgi:predicted ATP-grasp superfamily ATP-dependent carboligase
MAIPNRASGSTPAAYVLGDVDLVRALGLGGIRSVVLAQPGTFAKHSRFAAAVFEAPDPRRNPHELLARLLQLGGWAEERPVLYYDGDFELLLISRFRDELAERFRFVVPAPDLVEDLVDKVRFSRLAATHDLPVPPTLVLPTTEPPRELDLRFPVVVKQATRDEHLWAPLAASKVVKVDGHDELQTVWPRFAGLGRELVVQELIPGPESSIESYHVYLDERGEVRGEFTGKKIRTYPPAYGYSTAVVTTDAPDVAELGRELIAKIGLRGVAKFDFKRAPDGNLYLLEINPRFNLWHHLGAKAGVNIPVLVYSDLSGVPQPRAGPALPGMRWCSPRDFQAARAARIPMIRWLQWALSVEAKSVGAADDPMPLLATAASQFVSALRTRIRARATRNGDR